jgi:uncharacterized protein (TIGR02145 family)
LIGTITTINTANAINNGILSEGIAASGVSSAIPYTGGNGGIHNGQIVNSTGVVGLKATLVAGKFATGTGSLVYTITGTPATSGTATFAINIGGKNGSLNLMVNSSIGTYPIGSVFCSDTPTAVVDVLNPITGKTWMDRNLGASRVATSSNDAAAYGDLYQWGRRSDGHQCRNSAAITTTSSIDQPGHGNFIIASSTPFDWRNPQNTNLWQGVNGVNNPCPSGYRIPTRIELNAERLSWSSNNSMGGFSSPLKFTKAGDKINNGSLSGVGSDGYYWSSTVNGVNSHHFYFSDTNAGNDIPDDRASGGSIRCIKN